MIRLLTCLATISWVASQAAAPIHFSRTTWVVVEANNGRFVSTLGVRDFEIAVDGAPVAIDAVTAVDAPATILLLVDASASMVWGGRVAAALGIPSPSVVGNDYAGLVEGIERAIVGRLPTGDRLRIGRFGGGPTAYSNRFAADALEQRHAIRDVLSLDALDIVPGRYPGTIAQHDVSRRFAPSPAWDAVAASADLLADEPSPRAMILVTDGESTGNRLGVAEAALEAVRRGVTVHALYEPPWFGRRPAPWAEGDRLLRHMAELTGGLFRFDDRLIGTGWREAVPPFQDLINALHSGYTIKFTLDRSANDARSLDVRVKRPGLRVHAPHWVTK